jgi:hypothetical protein
MPEGPQRKAEGDWCQSQNPMILDKLEGICSLNGYIERNTSFIATGEVPASVHKAAKTLESFITAEAGSEVFAQYFCCSQRRMDSDEASLYTRGLQTGHIKSDKFRPQIYKYHIVI